MMELKTCLKSEKILVVFAMIFLRSSLQVDSSESDLPPEAIDTVEKTLLSLLGMPRRPMVDRSKAQIPDAMLNLYKIQMNSEYESTSLPLPGAMTRSANTVRSYTHQESSVDQKFPHSHKFRLNFNLSNFPENEILTSAELRLTVVPKENRSTCAYQRIYVHDIVLPGIKGETKPILRLIDVQTLHTSSDSTTITLDVSPAVQRWISDRKNYGILIGVKSSSDCQTTQSHVRLKRSTDVSSEPLLLLYTDDANRHSSTWMEPRRKRSSKASKRRPRNECRRHTLWVNFEKVGWNDWIVAPPGYDAYYCAGNCPTQYNEDMNTTNHAIVQSLVHDVHPSVIPQPCCVPTSLTSISMLYLDEQNHAVLKTYQDMVVDGCGCR